MPRETRIINSASRMNDLGFYVDFGEFSFANWNRRYSSPRRDRHGYNAGLATVNNNQILSLLTDAHKARIRRRSICQREESQRFPV